MNVSSNAIRPGRELLCEKCEEKKYGPSIMKGSNQALMKSLNKALMGEPKKQAKKGTSETTGLFDSDNGFDTVEKRGGSWCVLHGHPQKEGSKTDKPPGTAIHCYSIAEFGEEGARKKAMAMHYAITQSQARGDSRCIYVDSDANGKQYVQVIELGVELDQGLKIIKQTKLLTGDYEHQSYVTIYQNEDGEYRCYSGDPDSSHGLYPDGGWVRKLSTVMVTFNERIKSFKEAFQNPKGIKETIIK
jgi:hypothetical protein